MLLAKQQKVYRFVSLFFILYKMVGLTKLQTFFLLTLLGNVYKHYPKKNRK